MHIIIVNFTEIDTRRSTLYYNTYSILGYIRLIKYFATCLIYVWILSGVSRYRIIINSIKVLQGHHYNNKKQATNTSKIKY